MAVWIALAKRQSLRAACPSGHKHVVGLFKTLDTRFGHGGNVGQQAVMRLLDATASTRNLPDFTSGIDAGMLSNTLWCRRSWSGKAAELPLHVHYHAHGGLEHLGLQMIACPRPCDAKLYFR
jgi:hypothetical protein